MEIYLYCCLLRQSHLDTVGKHEGGRAGAKGGVIESWREGGSEGWS